jgi:hypothetical protein
MAVSRARWRVKNRSFCAAAVMLSKSLKNSSWIAPFQTQIGPNVESCASTGMFFPVTTDGDIRAAMQALFQQALAAARLTR